MISGAPAKEPFLQLLDSDPGKATAQLDLLRRRLEDFFKWRGCDDPEELADETLNRCYVAVAKGVAINTTIGAYVRGIAHYVYTEQIRVRARRQMVPLDAVATLATADHAHAIEQRMRVEQALVHLSEDERLLLRRYFAEGPRELGRDLDVPEGTLRVRVHRLVQRVRRAAANRP